MGFVRSTLRAHLCDLVMGVASANELLQNTNPYYRSTYVLAYRDGDELFADLDGAAMRDARIGVIAGTPPADLLVERGLLGQAQSYQLMVDTRYGDHPGKTMIDDLAAGRIDVALLWGPVAGYWTEKQDLPITLVPLHSDRPGQRLDFRISMGVRPGEPGWKQDLNDLIRELQPEINAILASYGVPLLDNRGRLMAPAPADGDAAATTDR
jgi:quinoprotein dehydrogenase-associated probable ABC transporter substrate-binding protein